MTIWSRINEFSTSLGASISHAFSSGSRRTSKAIKKENTLAFLVFFAMLTKTNASKATRSISMPPGSLTNAIVEFIYSKKKYERIFLPAINDMREEYLQALADGRKLKAKWIHVRGVWSVFVAALADGPITVLGAVKKLWAIAR